MRVGFAFAKKGLRQLSGYGWDLEPPRVARGRFEWRAKAEERLRKTSAPLIDGLHESANQLDWFRPFAVWP